jgi:hypothetical protein
LFELVSGGMVDGLTIKCRRCSAFNSFKSPPSPPPGRPRASPMETTLGETSPRLPPARTGPYSRPTGELPDYFRGADAVAGFGTRDFFVAWIPRKQLAT